MSDEEQILLALDWCLLCRQPIHPGAATSLLRCYVSSTYPDLREPEPATARVHAECVEPKYTIR